MVKKIKASICAPQGFHAAGVNVDIKGNGKTKNDVGVLYCDVAAATAGVFTTNKMAAPSIAICREVVKRGQARALLINSGCANACTGERGMSDARQVVKMLAEELKLSEGEIYNSSTGTIGRWLPLDKMQRGIKAAVAELNQQDGYGFAQAIMTTDTFLKEAACELELGGKKVIVAGIAKGAGMIYPNMATMLSYITTDAAIAPAIIGKMVKDIADKSFNMIVVDGDTSTNDSMIVMASGLAGNDPVDSVSHPLYQPIYDAILAISQELSQLIVRDGEGATKFLEIKVTSAKNFAEAKTVGMAIAKSPLVKTAFFGKDANWGRIVCAAGYSGAELNVEQVSLYIEDVCIMRNGLGTDYDKERLQQILEEKDIHINLDIAVGSSEATVWTCDFSYEYVKINAEYTT